MIPWLARLLARAPAPPIANYLEPSNLRSIVEPEENPVSVERRFLGCLPWHDGDVCNNYALYVTQDGSAVALGDTRGAIQPGFIMAAHARALALVGGPEHVVERLLAWNVDAHDAEMAVHRALKIARRECGIT